MVSLVKRSIHDDHSSYSSFTELPHPWFVTLFVRILAYLDHAALVLIFGSANNVTLLMVKAKMSERAANFLAILTTDCIQFIDYLSNSFSSISQVQIFWLRRQVLDLYKGGLRLSPIQFHRSPQTRGLVAISRLLVTHSTCTYCIGQDFICKRRTTTIAATCNFKPGGQISFWWAKLPVCNGMEFMHQLARNMHLGVQTLKALWFWVYDQSFCLCSIQAGALASSVRLHYINP